MLCRPVCIQHDSLFPWSWRCQTCQLKKAAFSMLKRPETKLKSCCCTFWLKITFRNDGCRGGRFDFSLLHRCRSDEMSKYFSSHNQTSFSPNIIFLCLSEMPKYIFSFGRFWKFISTEYARMTLYSVELKINLPWNKGYFYTTGNNQHINLKFNLIFFLKRIVIF